MSTSILPDPDGTSEVTIQPLVEVMARLRGPGGCPWDRAQTHSSLVRYLVEETHELVDAIVDGDDRAMCEELGDVLLQVAFHARIAEERGAFGLQDVVDTITAKMVARHPHVFRCSADGAVGAGGPTLAEAGGGGGAASDGAAGGSEDWERLKRAEGRSLLGGVARSLPALTRADLLTRKAARVGFDWPDVGPVFDKLDEEVSELRDALASGDLAHVAAELGDVLFVVANLARKVGVDPEAALHGTNGRFTRRFGHIEAALRRSGRAPEDATLGEMDALWREAKELERGAAEDD